MKKVKELFQRLNSGKNFEEKYPEFDMDDEKVHVLFISPCLHESGYSRMILPALELNRTDTHRAIISQIHKWDFAKQFDDYDSPIELRLVEWADYVVLPPMFTDVEYIVRNMRKINDEIEFVMDLDVNYHELPEYHPNAAKITEESKGILLKNLSRLDLLTAPNNAILNYYNALIQKHSDEFLLYFECYPNLLSQFTYSEIPVIKQNPGPKVRLGLLLDSSQGNDLRVIEKPLTALLEKHKEQLEVIIFGWSPSVSAQYNFLKDLPVTYAKPEVFTSYHYIINELCLDIGLIPQTDNLFNYSGKSLNRYLDFAAGMIPVVASTTPMLNKVIVDGENGLIAANDDEWITKIEKLISDGQLRKEMGKSAFAEAWENHSYSPRTIGRLKNIFI